MFGRRLALFAKTLGSKTPKVGAIKARGLYTDSIYPYPFNYINNTLYPSQFIYRENYKKVPWADREKKYVVWCMRFFWFYIFIHLFNDPGVITGHHTFPDPRLWTDHELGIPPLEAGSYKEWEASKLGVNEPEAEAFGKSPSRRTSEIFKV